MTSCEVLASLVRSAGEQHDGRAPRAPGRVTAMSAYARPIGRTLPRRHLVAFLSLFALPSAAQAILLTVVPLEALRLLGSARAVTFLYLATGLAGVVGRFSIPLLVRLLQRRFVFSLGTILLAGGAGFLAAGRLPALTCGMALSTFAFACIEITSNLYLLDHVPRHALRRFEPTRILASAGPWTLGPWLGVYLQHASGFAVPFVLAAIAAIALLALFWWLRLTDPTGPAPARRPPPNPVRYLPRFFGQPRMRLAWTLAAARSAWWNVFYVYAPIFAVTSGLGAEFGGAIVSVGTGWIWLVPLWGWVGRRYGLRRLLMVGYAAAGLLSLLMALVFHLPWVGAATLAMAALGTEMIDGAGNLLFLRAVHPYERVEMTTVFVSFRDVAQLGPPVVAAVLLSVFALPSVFAVSGMMMLASAAVTRHIPRRL
jgi:MFS transporter, ACDE family, multidrug resistance protein